MHGLESIRPHLTVPAIAQSAKHPIGEPYLLSLIVYHLSARKVHAFQHRKGCVHRLQSRSSHREQLFLPGRQNMLPAADDIVHHMTKIGQFRLFLYHPAQLLRIESGKLRNQKGCSLLDTEQRGHRLILHHLCLRRGIIQILSHLGIHIDLFQLAREELIPLQAGLQHSRLSQPSGAGDDLLQPFRQSRQRLLPLLVRGIYVLESPFVGGIDRFSRLGLQCAFLLMVVALSMMMVFPVCLVYHPTSKYANFF